jgi:F-type H+-transporting ATPase subunit b
MKKLLLALMFCGVVLCAQESAAKKEEAKAEAAEGELLPWKWVNFGLLALGLGYLMGKTLPPFFKSRTSEIQHDIVEAQAVKRDAEARAAAIEQRVSRLGADIAAFKSQSQAEMEQEAARIRQETVHMMEKVQKQAALEIESSSKAAQRELKTYAAKLSLELAEQRIRTRLDAATGSGLVDDFVRELKSEGSNN